MATAALRAVLVAAAVVLGVFVLSRAFPTGSEATGPVTAQPSPSVAPTTPAPTQGTGGQAPEPHQPSEIRMQILNGTDVSGLAADTQVLLEEEGYRVGFVGDAESKPVERTTIAYKRDYKADAQVLRDQFFPDAELEVAAPDADTAISVTLGVDYAEAQEGA